VGVSQLRRHVKKEVFRVFDDGLPQFDHGDTALLERLLQQDRLYLGIRLLQNVLNQDWLPKLDLRFQSTQVVGVGELHHHQLAGDLHLLNPLVLLALGINSQGPPPLLVQNDGILDRETVVGQTLDHPVTDQHLNTQRFLQRVHLRARNLHVPAQLLPVLGGVIAKIGGELPQILDHPTTHQHVPRHIVQILTTDLTLFAPTNLFSAEGADQLFLTLEFLFAKIHLELKIFLLLLETSELLLELSELVHDLLQFSLLYLQFLHNFLVIGLCLLELDLLRLN